MTNNISLECFSAQLKESAKEISKNIFFCKIKFLLQKDKIDIFAKVLDLKYAKISVQTKNM